MITIIVLLILAGVALATLTGNTSIIDNANKAAEKYNASANEDQKILNQVKDLFAKYMGGEQTGETGDDDTPTQNYAIIYNANGGSGNMSNTVGKSAVVAANTYTAPGNARVFKEWNTVANGTGTSYAPGDSVSLSENLTLYAIWNYTTASVLSIGNEVSIKGEEFYVLENSSNIQEDVTLLAKYNLDKNLDATTGKYYQKANATSSETACAFSSINYWAEKWNQTESGVARRFDLNNEIEYGAVAEGDAIDRAKNYAQNTLDLTRNAGRLLTYEEANALQSTYGDMIYGRTNQQGENTTNYFYYWLSSACENYVGGVWFVDGYGDGDLLNDSYLNLDNHMGVRPVITVSKSLIQ